MVDPFILCRKHLLGEHVEHRMFAGTINKRVSINGYLKNNLLEPLKLKQRHRELAKEMSRRGYSHKSELPEIQFDNLTPSQIAHKINKTLALNNLISRCSECKERFKTIG
jgi:hypothetical protein